MDSKISLKIIFSIFSIFIVHLFLYYISPTYGDYFKNVKYDWSEINKNVQNDNKIKWVSSYTWSNFVIPDINEDFENNTNLVEEEYSVAPKEKTLSNNLIDEETLTAWDELDFKDDSVKQEVLDLFVDFDLTQKEESQNSSLFWLTNEYPYEYDEYYSRDRKMSLYFFKDKEYLDILNVFDVISYNLFFKVKKVNNFWDKSFYINLDADLDDNYIRFVFSYRKNNFWLKIKKDWYNEVKKIMKTISKVNK